MSVTTTTTVTEIGTPSTNGRFYKKPRDRPEGEGATHYPEGNPRSNSILHPPDNNYIKWVAVVLVLLAVARMAIIYT